MSATTLELELRFLRPKQFTCPDRLAGLELVSSSRAVHRDHYYDAADNKGRPILQRKSCSLRVRKQGPEQALLTFKQRAEQSSTGVARLETQGELYGPVVCDELLPATVNHLSHPALNAARRLVGDHQLVELFTISCDRTDHVYRGREGELVLSEDRITYPDGSHEERIEVELVRGGPELLVKAERKLRRRHSALRVASRGKHNEARRRLGNLLGIA